MNITFPDQKPGLLTAVAVMTLTSGIINLFWGFVASATALGTIVGVICLPITILPTILGAFEIVYAAKLLGTQPQAAKPSPSIAVFEILTFLMGNIFSVVVGTLSLIFYNDASIKSYFEGAGRVQGLMLTGPQFQPAAVLETAAEPSQPSLPEPEKVKDSPKPKRSPKDSGK